MKNNTRKTLLALLLVVTMLLGLTSVSASAASEEGKITIYFQNNWLWSDVSCYYWGSTTQTNPDWPGIKMTVAGTQEDYDVYSIDIPADVEGLIINGIKNDGSGALDQTPDIKTGIVDNAGWKMDWQNGNATLPFTYNPDQVPVETSYTVAGTGNLCGTEWDTSNTANDLVLGADGVYSKTYTSVAAGEVKFKVVKNHSWAKAWPSSDYVLNLTETSDVTIKFNPDTQVVSVEHVPAGETPVDPPVDPNPPVEGGEETGLTGDYYLAGYINGADYGIAADSANLGIYKFVDGKLTMNFTSESYVIVKNGNNVGYWTMTYCQEKTATLHNSSTGAGEKMYVPAGQVTFTLTKGEGDTLVLSYASGGSAPSVTPSEPAENPIEPENGYYTVYVYNTAWWDIVGYYVWNDAGDVRAEWPGQEAYEDTYLLYPIMVPADYSYIIINDGGSNQTADIALVSIDKSATVFNNGTGEWMSLEDYDPNLEIPKPVIPDGPDYSEYETVRVYLGNTLGWENANFYTWSNDSAIGQMAAWPGLPMEYDDVTGLYYADVPVCFDRIIFNNGTAQTLDLYVPAAGDSKVVCDNSLVVGAAGGGVDGSDCWVALGDYEAPDPILPPTTEVTVVFRNDAGWAEVLIHYWGGEGETTWPGFAMEKGADGLYYAVVPAGTTGIVFNDGNGNQTDDLRVPTGDEILFSNGDMQWHYHKLNNNSGNNNNNNGGNTDTDGGSDDVTSAPKLNFFQKIIKIIVLLFQKLFAGFKK